MNNDVVQEILLHLPVQSLLRFRAVSKSWRGVVDSTVFRKLHTYNNDNNNNNMVCLQLKFLIDKQQHCKLSIKLLDNGRPISWFNLPPQWHPNFVSLVGPVKGLICIYSKRFQVRGIAICNPFLGQFKILPKSPFYQCLYHDPGRYHVGIGMGFDGDDYKVVEFVFCYKHTHCHARVYSRRRDSWRELAGDNGVFDQINSFSIRPVKSSSKNGYFAHWMALGEHCQYFVLSFDMRNEVFRASKIRVSYRPTTTVDILAMDGEGEETSFVVFSDDGWNARVVEIYEQGGDLKYLKAMAKLEDPLSGFLDLKMVNNRRRRRREVIAYDCFARELVVLLDFEEPSWRKGGSEYVALFSWRRREVSLYDYRAREFVGRFELPEGSKITEYVGSFISV